MITSGDNEELVPMINATNFEDEVVTIFASAFSNYIALLLLALSRCKINIKLI